jgi:hypothetical protein
MIHATISLSAEGGVKVTLQSAPVGKQYDTIHNCDFCMSGPIEWFVEGTVSAKLKLFTKALSFQWENEEIKFGGKLCDWFVSFCKTGIDSGEGECPHVLHRVTLEVVDPDGNPVEGAEVTAEKGLCDADNDGNTQEHTMLTNSQGKADFFFPLGIYQVEAKKTGVGLASQKLIFRGAATARIQLVSQVHEGTSGALTWKLDEDGTLTIRGNGGMNNHSTFNTSDAWLKYRDRIKKVVITEGVTSIGNYVFAQCALIDEIVIPDSVTTIGEWAMYRCTGLKKVTVPDSVTSIGKYSFYQCYGLTTVEIGDNVTGLGDHVFAGCTSLSQITFSKKLSAIPSGCCQDCTSLKTVVVPDSVLNIGGSAFKGCTSLRDVMLGSSVNSVEGNAFQDCVSLVNLSLGNVVTIGNNAFSGDKALKSLNIPDSCRTIDSYAFNNCSSLQTVSFGSGLTTIGLAAFSHCSSLGPVVLPDGITSIGSSAFNGDNNMTSIYVPISVKSINKYAFYGEGIFVYYAGSKDQWNEIASGEHTLYSGKHLICESSASVSKNAVKSASFVRTATGEKSAFLAHTAPGYEYVLLVVRDLNAEELLAADNLLYIDQKTADGEMISFRYLPRDAAAKTTAKIFGVDSRDLPAPHEHSYTETVTTEATCTQPGVKTFTCACGDSYAEAIPATGEHTYGEWTVTKPATAEAEGEETRECTVCGEKETRPIDKQESAYATGDVNNDDKVGSDDARLALRVSVNLEKDIVEGTAAYAAADVNNDGKVGSDDARTILRVAVNLESFG